jgi:hypothetical protein
VSENPKGVGFGITDNQQVANDKIDALGVTHFWEMVCNAFENVLKRFPFYLRQLKCSIKIFFDLSKAFVVVNSWNFLYTDTVKRRTFRIRGVD